jgi:hypothetical protein
MGGLGNQMFQYAFGLYTARNNNTTLKIDSSLLSQTTTNPNHVYRNFELDLFDIEFNFASKFEVELFNGNPDKNIIRRGIFKVLRKSIGVKLFIQKNHDFNEKQLKLKNNTCIVGRWQSEYYFKSIENEIRQKFTFRKEISKPYEGYKEKILNTPNATCLHIRRADYVNHPIYSKKIGSLPDSYYIKSIEQLNSMLPVLSSLFIFSDDIKYTKQMLQKTKLKNEQIFIHTNNPNPHDELQLMTKCQHHIISNSTFSWWGAWLSEKQEKSITIAPKTWAKSSEFRPPKIHCKNWLLF